MSTLETIRVHGALPVVLFLLLTLAVTALRLLAVPFALAVLVLDGGANLAAAVLAAPVPDLGRRSPS